MQSKNQSVILTSFLDEEKANSTDTIVAQIQTCNDLELLAEYSGDTSYGGAISKAANARLNEHMDEILATITDTDYLAKIYRDTYWLSSGCLRSYGILDEKSHGGKIIARMRALYKNITVVDELFPLMETQICGTEYTAAAVKPVQERLLELIALDERKGSFLFLLNAWRRLSLGLSYRDQLAKLMPEALKKEKDLSKLWGWVNPQDRKPTTWNSWNHADNDASRAVQARMNELILKRIPQTVSYEVLDSYCHTAEFTSGNKAVVKAKVDARMERVFRKKLRGMETLSEVLEYEATMYNIHQRYNKYPKAQAVFIAKIDELVPITLAGLTSAADVYPLIAKLKQHYTWQTNMALSRLLELAPSYFTENRDIKTAVKWSNEFGGEVLNGIVVNLIANENSAKVLMSLHFSKNENCLPLAHKRFGELLLALRAPTKWFEECIQKKEFFGNKSLFLQKAQEFVKLN